MSSFPFSRRIGSTFEVMFSGGSSTDRESNHGLMEYIGQSVEADEAYFTASLRFYGILRSLEGGEKRPKHVFAPIELRSERDFYSIALEAAHGNPYLALKILITYGHDNLGNFLSKRGRPGTARTRELDALAPASNSMLYLNGAIGGLEYDPIKVREGQAIARDCMRLKDNDPLHKLCNDRQDSYQGDYYHVITAAFLECREVIAAKARWSIPISFAHPGLPLGEGLFDAIWESYIHDEGVRSYKLARFREEVKGAEEDASFYYQSLGKEPSFSKGFIALLREGLDRIASGETELLPPIEKLRVEVPPREYEAARLILNRYRFEVGFREYQHRLGRAFGAKACKGMRSFKQPAGPSGCESER